MREVSFLKGAGGGWCDVVGVADRRSGFRNACRGRSPSRYSCSISAVLKRLCQMFLQMPENEVAIVVLSVVAFR